MEIIYCERCSRRISLAEIEGGRALSDGATSFCPDCVSKLSPEERARFHAPDARSGHRPAGHATSSRRATVRAASGRATGSGPPFAFVVIAISGAVLGAVAVFLVAGSGDEKRAATVEHPTPPPPSSPPSVPGDATTKPHAPPRPAPAPATPTAPPEEAPPVDPKRELEAARALLDEKLTRYAEIRTRLRALADVKDSSAAKGEALKLLDEIDAKYAAAAERALAAALPRAEEFAYVGKLDDVRATLNSVGATFADGPWLEKRGRSLIRESVERLASRRSDAIAAALARARAKLEAGDLGAAQAALGNLDAWPDAQRGDARTLLDEIAARRPKAEPARQTGTSTTTAPRGQAKPAPPPPTKRPAVDWPDAMPQDVLNGIVGYWPFDEGRGAVSAAKYGKGKAMLRNGAGWGVGVLGSAVALDGTDDFALLPNNATWNLNAKSFTISLWTDNARGPFIIAKGKGQMQGWSLGGARFGVCDTTHAIAECRFAKGLPKGWCHFAITFDARTGTMRGYVNGVAKEKVVAGDAIGGFKNVNEPTAPTLGARQGGLHGDYYEGRIDEIRAYARALSDDEVSALYWRTRMLARDARLKTVEKKLGLVGGAAVGDRSLARLVTAQLGEGYTLARSSGVAGRNVLAARLAATVEIWARREKPEAVVVALDAADVLRGAKPADIAGDVAFAVDKLLSLGVEVTMFTATFARPAAESAQMTLARYNQVLVDTARRRGVQLIDVYGLMNTDPATTRRYFSRGSSLTDAGSEALANEIVRAYRGIERSKLGRAVAVPGSTIASRPGGAARAPEPGRDDGPTPGAPPVSNADLVVNGGFEQVSPHTRFATNWMGMRFGEGRGQYSVRLTRSNPHDGERAVELRALAPEVNPGMQTTLNLAKGEYEVTFWACADADRPVLLSGSLAGANLSPQALGGDYKKLTVTATVPEATRGGVLKLWIVAPNVRVWVDDVSVRRVK